MKFIAALLIAVFTLLGTACPKANKTIRSLEEKSAEMSIYGRNLIEAFGKAHDEGVISDENLRGLNIVTDKYVLGVSLYNKALAEAKRKVQENPDTAKVTIAELDKYFDAQVVAVFFEILTEVGALSISRSEVIQTILASIRLTILTIKQTFSATRVQLAEVNNHA